MVWNASMATQAAITPTYSGWSEYPMKADTCGRKAKTSSTNSSDVLPIESNIDEYTRMGSSSFLLAKRKNDVSMPYVRITSSRAT